MQEYEGYSAQLNFLRNVDKKEVDFLVSIDNEPWFCVEVKQTDTTPSSNLYYFRDRLQIPYVYQIVKKEKVDTYKNNVRIISADRFLASLF